MKGKIQHCLKIQYSNRNIVERGKTHKYITAHRSPKVMCKAVYDFLTGFGFSWELLVFTSHELIPAVQDPDSNFIY